MHRSEPVTMEVESTDQIAYSGLNIFLFDYFLIPPVMSSPWSALAIIILPGKPTSYFIFIPIP